MADTRQSIRKEIDTRLVELRAELKEMNARREKPGLNIFFSIFDAITPTPSSIQVTEAKIRALTELEKFLDPKNNIDIAAFKENFNKYYLTHDGSDRPSIDSRVFASTGFSVGKTEALFNKVRDLLTPHKELPADADADADTPLKYYKELDSNSDSDSDSDSDSSSLSP